MTASPDQGGSTVVTSTARRQGTRSIVALHALVLSFLSWLRAENVTDDRGSDSSEKAFMVILAIGLGTAVTVAAVAFVNSKTALFK
jgi:uncharacterized membrane protein YidH (DUF202 family)